MPNGDRGIFLKFQTLLTLSGQMDIGRVKPRYVRFDTATEDVSLKNSDKPRVSALERII